MGLAKDYIWAHKVMAGVVEVSFRKMAKHCEFGKSKLPEGRGDIYNINVILKHNKVPQCHYPGGDNGGVCAREICPVLEKE